MKTIFTDCSFITLVHTTLSAWCCVYIYIFECGYVWHIKKCSWCTYRYFMFKDTENSSYKLLPKELHTCKTFVRCIQSGILCVLIYRIVFIHSYVTDLIRCLKKYVE